MSKIEKDYTLLREFDPEKARAGEAICTNDGTFRQFIVGPDDHGYFCVKTDEGGFAINQPSYYRMAPLSWLEGRPVYEGAEAYGKYSGDLYVAKKDGWQLMKTGAVWAFTSNEDDSHTWTKPAPKKIKRTARYLAYEDLLGVVLHVKEGVYVDRRWDRLPEFDLSREIEEEVKP